MKAVKCLIIIVCISCFLLPEDPLSNPLEIFLSTVNHENSTTIFYAKATSAVYMQNTFLPTDEYYDSDITVTGNIPSLLIGWDFKHPGAPDSYGDVDTVGFGVYKFSASTSGTPHFYLNNCDCRYTSESGYPSQDLDIQFDGNRNTFYYKPRDGGGNFTEIINGETINIWNALNATGAPTSDCFLSSFTPSNLSLSYVNNKAKLTWSIEHPDTVGAYKIYRTVWENGQFNNQTTVKPPIVTVDSWIDDDFTRFKFGNYTIDYEVAYLSLPPNESAKSNKVSTTSGNWNGPVVKTMTDDFELNIHPNPFNSSVVIPLKKNTSSIIIYNL